MIKSLAYQQQAVSELVKKSIDLLYEPGTRKKIVFKAPTGAGKTVMASELLDRLTTELADEGKEIAIIWIAPNKLHQQSYLKMRNFFTETRVLQPVMYDELDTSVNGYIKPGEVFFINWESINKDSNILVRETEKSASLYDITRRTQQDHDVPIVVVIDEEHMFGGRQAKQSEKVLKTINPKLEIRISATPITANPDALVSISRSKVIREEMIKDGISINPLVQDSGTGLSANEYLLEEALKKRTEIKNAYDALGIRINPLLLIQLPNDNSEALDEDEVTIKNMVTSYLEANHDITTKNGKLAIWLSAEKENLEGLENDYNLTDVLLFKQAIALGWDCPRASVLLIFRDIQSTTFGVQTVGRIMRMPEQKYYTEAILNHGFVYTNLSREKIEIVAEDMNYITKALVANRREPICNVKLPSMYSERLGADRNRLGPDFYEYLVKAFNDKWLKLPVQLNLFSPFEGEGADDSLTDDFMINTTLNRETATRVAGIKFDVQTIQVQIMRDVEISGEAGVTFLEDNQTIRYARNAAELNEQLAKFCAACLTRFEKVSIVTLRSYLMQFMEEYFGLFETETPKVVLYHLNRPKFREVIDLAIKYYLNAVNSRRAAAKARAFKGYDWEIPEWREYNEAANHVEPSFVDHALIPFIQLNLASKPEKRFETFLESNKEYIDWWYKNGDEGKQHYAISYQTMEGSQSLFYIDFVIRMKNGQIFLFDTKSVGSDLEGPNKHNALIDYINAPNNKKLNLKGGIIIEDEGNWKYSPLKISDTENLTGWDAFHPDLYR